MVNSEILYFSDNCNCCNLDLAVTIAKIVQDVLENGKNENIREKNYILEKKLTLHDILTQILNNS